MDSRQIQQVRHFNRVVTQRIGALEESYLRRGRPLGEARLIFEAGAHGADVRALRSKLGLDSGYLSRLLRSLEAQGLILVDKQIGDGRLRRVSLTPKGQAEFAAYEGLSDELAQSILAPLEAAQRDRLVDAMAEVERLIRVAAVDVRIEAPGSEDARWCLDEYFHELTERFESGFDPTKSNPARDDEMAPPAGVFIVARLDGCPAGCCALKFGDKTTGEIKRMWTASSARGRGIARKMLQTLEAIARDAGLTALRLETNRTLKEAQALYRSEGYREVAPFNDEPYAHHWFAKDL
ncbi:helix-turn-helix domain-containing GNAT family N-acetyltransferase [Methylocapsa sp. S129]|uniref:bifunctional helix-turn-helix transcriptional regulator/GNAT family N-acetyltransferase n=1 Tax=Methylocapsa sp. S129 TaxID=1641869 RepID=UPI00131EB34F|nr:helix-turn-helix domain-containing GNAT family N-acetyltransferase [Methylocapsa sp. S129]